MAARALLNRRRELAGRQRTSLKLNVKLNETRSNPTKRTMFDKHFLISDAEKIEYTLPDPETVFGAQPWWLDSLQKLKSELNEVKNRLNNFVLDEWQQHTFQMNRAGDVLRYVRKCIQPEFVTQAWCKFYEIACSFPLVPLSEITRDSRDSFASVHLCEAPGAFVVALNHWLKLNARHVRWDWTASTLNPYCEGNPYSQMVEDDRFIRHTLRHWCFGADNTGNLMNLRNLDALAERTDRAEDESGPIMLVTADGSIDCIDMPGEQENAVAHLHFCETIACMHLLRKGGNFLLKIFTLFEHQSVCLMYLLSCAFHRVTVTKPATSKPGNSEMYVVCTNFKGADHVARYLSVFRRYYDALPSRAMFDRRDIPDCFVQTIENCGRFFKLHQCKIIEDNISAFEISNDIACGKRLLELAQIRKKIAVTYLKNNKLGKIGPADELVGRSVVESSGKFIVTKKMNRSSYNERCKRQNLDPHERLRQIWSEAWKIELPAERSYTWNVQALPETLEIQTGKPFNKIHSSRFCEAKVHQMLNEMQDMQFLDGFPPTKIAEKCVPLINPNYEILSFQCAHDNHRTIVDIYDRLEKLRSEQTLILIGYPLLTQLNVGLLYILGSSFDKTTVNIHEDGGYHVKLETYRPNEKMLNYLREISTASCNARKKNMTVSSLIPITALYEWTQYPVIIQVNHLMIKLCIDNAFSTMNKM